MLKHYAMKWLLLGVTLALIGGGAVVVAQIFGMGDYPGGSLKLAYEITSEESATPSTFAMEVTPEGDDTFRVKTISEAVQKREDLALGLFSLFFMGFHYRPEEEDVIDLTALQALDEREVEPNKSYVLPGGTRLETLDRSNIAGVDAVMGIFTDPDLPDQRAILALSDLNTRKLLPFPPLLQVEEKKDGEFQPASKIELIEFIYQE